MSALIKSTASVSAMTLLSRLLGLARDIVIARFFSASDAADAFFVAFKIPNFLRRLFAEGAFSLAFVPVLTEYRNNYTAAQTRDLIDRVAGTLGGILLLLSLFGVLASPLLISIFAAGFLDQPAKFDLTADMLRITFPYILLISMTAMAGGILNTWKRFTVPAFTPVLLNLSLIGCAMYLSPRLEVPITGLAWGVFVAGVAQLLFQLPFLYREGLLPKPRWGWRHEGVQKIVKLMIPALFGSSVAQINLLFDTFIASFLMTGSVAWLYYSDRLLEFPLGVFGIALATVVLPNLSEAHYKKGATHFNDTLRWAIQLSLLIAVPATFGLFLLAQPILATLFQYGAFSANDSIMAAYSLMAYCLGLPAFILIKILANGFYARQDTRTPVRIGIQAMVFNMVLNLVFVVSMVQADFIAPHVGLALATSASAYFNAFRLAQCLQRDSILGGIETFSLPLLKILGACIAMTALIQFMLPDVTVWSELRWYGRLAELAWLIVPAILCYGIVLWIMGFRPRHFIA
ncbi:MAG: murein biosynthesis integral membrane protein MurJ [Gammaproteobacteria bacterium]|nr:MAG: murein biosynthesis integral membrane protein MurJ [Gammaproteobacteria bacterium]UCH39354.1 MAG: murein biosynthesis integral membrane protein MurJ [Gammaproteobacteria bacterium]